MIQSLFFASAFYISFSFRISRLVHDNRLIVKPHTPVQRNIAAMPLPFPAPIVILFPDEKIFPISYYNFLA